MLNKIHYMCTILIVFYLSCTSLFIRNNEVHSSTIKDSRNNTVGWWTPLSVHFFLYDVRDSLILTNSLSYDSIFKSEGVHGAYLHFTNDSLYECILYDTCYKECSTAMFYKGNQVYFQKQPLLLSNSSSGIRKDESLILNDTNVLQSTITVYFDSLQEKRFKRSVTSVLLKHIDYIPVINNISLCK